MRNEITQVDFEASTVTYVVKDRESYGMFPVEAVCTVQEGGSVERYYALSPVVACNVFGTGQLIKDPPYRFQALFSESSHKIFRTYLDALTQGDTVGSVAETFEDVELRIRERTLSELETSSEIVEWARSGKRLFCRLSYSMVAAHGGQRAVTADFPVRHINTDPQRGIFQVETGTIPLPEGVLVEGSNIQNFLMCYVAFNTKGAVDILALPFSKVIRRDCHIRLYGSPEAEPRSVSA